MHSRGWWNVQGEHRNTQGEEDEETHKGGGAEKRTIGGKDKGWGEAENTHNVWERQTDGQAEVHIYRGGAHLQNLKFSPIVSLYSVWGCSTSHKYSNKPAFYTERINHGHTHNTL